MNQENRSVRQTAEEEIDKIASQFFDLFTNTNNRKPNIRAIKEFFLPNGMLINNTSGVPEVYDLEGFIRPREDLLTNGTLTDFIEKESSYKTEIHENIAQRMSYYVKSGRLNNEPFTGEGKKLMQFVKVVDKWFLSSVIWTDKK